MRLVLAAIAMLAAVCGAAPGPAQDGPAPAPAAVDPRSLPVATEIVEFSFPPATRRAMFANAVDTMMAQARRASTEATGERFSAAVEAILDRHLALARAQIDHAITDASPEIFAAMARAYARRLTYDELAQVRAFAATPAGAKFLQSGTNILADPDVARANTAYMSAALAAIRPLQAQLMEELRAHFGEDGQEPVDRPTGTR
jgi:hypothetical protein